MGYNKVNINIRRHVRSGDTRGSRYRLDIHSGHTDPPRDEDRWFTGTWSFNATMNRPWRDDDSSFDLKLDEYNNFFLVSFVPEYYSITLDSWTVTVTANK